MTTKILIVKDQPVYELSCDKEVVVPDDGAEYTAADLVYTAGLKEARTLKQTVVAPGTYIVRMMSVVTINPDTEVTVEAPRTPIEKAFDAATVDAGEEQ